ncbi:DCC family protein At1g52590, chloroplastic [Physcomitrium patens]|uniref:Thiol-disulfide oxidoreductase DCC n=1 Tax=Physcomitrium patens TaxID=3218 RepID=A0A2K1L8C5_PHYPA|nr:DCC family protein At1g52590, chloroplastic-like [Physcomitrium patens]PNR62289.1 hypothetical protein PHYPA_000713 [Physcomitrium patens]|eukprot:XP_024399173.1 DCC family protein At1g52590, chloroplastic-like [Physcomitrella patens]
MPIVDNFLRFGSEVGTLQSTKQVAMAASLGVAQIAAPRLEITAGVPVAQIVAVGASNHSFGNSRTALRLNQCNRPNRMTSPRNMRSMSIRAAANTATSYGTESREELLRRADSYFATDSRPIVLFDGVCNFCNAGVNFVLDNDPEGRVRMAALQSEAGRALLLRAGRLSDDLSSLVLIEKDRSYIKSEGVLRTAQYLGNLLPPVGSLGLLFPLFFRDFVYDNVANNRYSILGKRDQCRVSDPRFNDRFVV